MKQECELVSVSFKKDVSLQTDITNYIKEEMPGINRAKNMNFAVKLSDIEIHKAMLKTAGTTEQEYVYIQVILRLIA